MPDSENGRERSGDLVVRRRVTVIRKGPGTNSVEDPSVVGDAADGVGRRLDNVLTGAISDAVADRVMDVISQQTDWWLPGEDSAFTQLADRLESADAAVHKAVYRRTTEKFLSAVHAELPVRESVSAVASEFPLPFDEAVDHASVGLKVIGVVVFTLVGHVQLAAGCARSLLRGELRRTISDAVREAIVGPRPNLEKLTREMEQEPTDSPPKVTRVTASSPECPVDKAFPDPPKPSSQVEQCRQSDNLKQDKGHELPGSQDGLSGPKFGW